MAIRTPKALFHPDGVLFVIWHKTQEVYCPVFSDEDVPPAAKDLDLDHSRYAGYSIDTLIWLPIRVTAKQTVEETVTAPYDSYTGEQF